MKAVKRLYFARAQDQNIFIQKPGDRSKYNLKTSIRQNVTADEEEALITNELKKHRVIRLRDSDWLKLFCTTKSPLASFFQQGQRRLEQECELLSMVKRLRHLEILLENSLLTKQRSQMVAHTYHNIIDLDQDLNENFEAEKNGEKHLDFDLENYEGGQKVQLGRATKKPNAGQNTDHLPQVLQNSDTMKSEESESPQESPRATRLWYFAKDEDIKSIKFFETEIDQNLKKAVLFKKQFFDGAEDSFEKSSKYVSASSQTPAYKKIPFSLKRPQTAPVIDISSDNDFFGPKPDPDREAIEFFTQRREETRNFEAKMIAFLALQENISHQGIPKSPQKRQSLSFKKQPPVAAEHKKVDKILKITSPQRKSEKPNEPLKVAVSFGLRKSEQIKFSEKKRERQLKNEKVEKIQQITDLTEISSEYIQNPFEGPEGQDLQSGQGVLRHSYIKSPMSSAKFYQNKKTPKERRAKKRNSNSTGVKNFPIQESTEKISTSIVLITKEPQSHKARPWQRDKRAPSADRIEAVLPVPESVPTAIPRRYESGQKYKYLPKTKDPYYRAYNKF